MNRASDGVEMKWCNPQPYLPPGMSVDHLTACILSARPTHPITQLVFKCAWEPPLSNRGGPESGESLEAQSWKNGHQCVMVGTEDYETLSGRLPQLTLREESNPVKYLDNGFEIKIPLIEWGQEISLHYVVASNPFPEPMECSCWYAVDIPHKELLNKIVFSTKP